VEDVPVSLALGHAIKDTVDKDTIVILSEAENDMYKNKLANSRSTKSAVLNALQKTLEAKSFETEEHSNNIQAVALQIGEKLELPETELNRLRLLSSLHDIGKINIPEDVLTKEGSLSNEEWELVKKHPEIGWRITRATDEFVHVADEILAHLTPDSATNK